MRTAIRLSPIAVKQIEDILSEGKGVDIKVVREKRGDRLLIRELVTKTKYDVVFSE